MSMEKLDLAVKNGIVVLGGGRYRIGIGVKDGKVALLAPEEMMPEAKETIDAKGNYVLPELLTQKPTQDAMSHLIMICEQNLKQLLAPV